MNAKLAAALAKIVPLYEAKHAAMPRSFSSAKPLPRKFHEAEGAYQSAMDECASDPDLRKHMTCWMLDFCGSEEPSFYRDGKGRPKAPKSAKELATMISGTESKLAQRVSDWLQKQKADVTDSGSGFGGWHLGARCSDSEAEALCVGARRHFAKEIKSGALRLELHHWGWNFREIHDPKVRAQFRTAGTKSKAVH